MCEILPLPLLLRVYAMPCHAMLVSFFLISLIYFLPPVQFILDVVCVCVCVWRVRLTEREKGKKRVPCLKKCVPFRVLVSFSLSFFLFVLVAKEKEQNTMQRAM